MGVRLKITNPNLNIEERTYLGSDYSSGTALTVRDNDGFTATNFVVVGEPGQEQTEDRAISSLTSTTTITIASALSFAHPKSTPVYESLWDQVSLERASSVAGSYSEVAKYNLEWENRDLVTYITDSSGSSASFYKWRFYNTVTASYSDYSGILPGGGLDKNTTGYALQQIMENPIAEGVSTETIFKYMTDFQDYVYEEMPKAWWFDRMGTPVATTVDSSTFNIDDNWPDLESIKYVFYRYVSGETDTTVPLTYITPLEMRNRKSDSTADSSDPAGAWSYYPPDADSAKGYIVIDSASEATTNYVYPEYFIDLEPITSFADVLVVPKRKGYEDYVFYRIYRDILRDQENANTASIDVKSALKSLRGKTKRQHGQDQFRRYRGQKGFARMFSNYRGVSPDTDRERYW